MNLVLSEIKELVATENIKCDAVQSFFDFMNHIPTELKMKYIFDLFRVRKIKIQPTEKYLKLIFVDADTGEGLEMNCKIGVHCFCIKRTVYSPLILSAIKNA